MNNLESNVSDVVEKTVEVAKPVVKEVVSNSSNLLRDLGFMALGSGVTVGIQKAWKWLKSRKVKDKNFYNKDDVVAESDYKEVTEETEENQETPEE